VSHRIWGLTVADLTGRVILGSSANQDSWHGDILGLAIFMTSIFPHPRSLNMPVAGLRGQPPAANSDHAPSVLYKFDEHSGNLITGPGRRRKLLS